MARQPLYLNTRTFTSHLFFGPYIFLPLIGALTWLGGILALLLLWVTAGKPRYKAKEASVVFISDVGAVHHALFIAISCVTGASYILSLFAERWLRHVDRLPTDLRRREKIFDWVAIVCGTIGSIALMMLSIFDAFNYSTVHWSMTLVFIVGIALSAIFQSGEIWSLHKDHPDRKSLLRNSIYKLVVVTVAILVAIAFGGTYAACGGDSTARNGHSAATCNRITSVAAALEWTVAFILIFFFLTLVADLWPAGKSSERYMRRLARWQEKHGEGDDFTGRRAFDMYPERWEDRYDGMRQKMHDRNTGQDRFNRDSTATDAPMVGNQGPQMSQRSAEEGTATLGRPVAGGGVHNDSPYPPNYPPPPFE